VIDTVLKATGASQTPLNYVDLAAGTGIFTRLLIDACTQRPGNSFRLKSITAVEPAEGMRTELSRLLFDKGGFVPQLKSQDLLQDSVQTTAVEGRFDSIDLSSLELQGNVDLLTIAQAWHWCEDWDAALKTIAQVLKKDGILAIVWNLEDREAGKARKLTTEVSPADPPYSSKHAG
jgi:SAM-dependent methyltransferase